MKLTLGKYTVSRKTLELVLSALGNNHFTAVDDGDGYMDSDNNDDVIEADNKLQAEIAAQEPNPKVLPLAGLGASREQPVVVRIPKLNPPTQEEVEMVRKRMKFNKPPTKEIIK